MRVLAFVAILGFAASAFGATIDVRFGPGTTGIVEGDTVTMIGSDFAEIQIWAMDLSTGLSFWGLSVAVDAVGDPVPADFTYEGSTPGPEQYAGGFNPGTGLPAWVNGYAYPYLQGHFPEVHLFSVLIHCTGEISEHDIFTHWNAGAANISDGGGLPYTMLEPDFYDVVHISQVPEPTPLALLALGGLALIRRR